VDGSTRDGKEEHGDPSIRNEEHLEDSDSLLLRRLLNNAHLDSLAVVAHSLLIGGLDTSGVSLLGEGGLTDLLLLHLVDGFNEDGLVLEQVTLGAEVEVMVDVLSNLLGIAVLDQEASEDSLAAHPQDLDGHTRVSGTLPLAGAVMSALTLGLLHASDAGTRVHLNLLAHDQTVLHQFADVFAYKNC
jgi:hypothetical protein